MKLRLNLSDSSFVCVLNSLHFSSILSFSKLYFYFVFDTFFENFFHFSDNFLFYFTFYFIFYFQHCFWDQSLDIRFFLYHRLSYFRWTLLCWLKINWDIFALFRCTIVVNRCMLSAAISRVFFHRGNVRNNRFSDRHCCQF